MVNYTLLNGVLVSPQQIPPTMRSPGFMRTTDAGRQRYLFSIAVLSLCLLSAVVFFPSLSAFFVSDDFIQLFYTRRGPFAAWSDHTAPFLRPFISLSLHLDHLLWGMNPFGFHLTNVAVHTMNAVLVMLITRRLVAPSLPEADRIGVAGIAGLVFLLLPAHSEPVSWISGRADVVCTFWALMTFLLYLRYRELRHRRDLALSLGCFSVALASKEAVLMLPLVLLAYEAYRRWGARDENRRFAWEPLLYIGMLPFYLAVRYAVIGKLVGGYGNSRHLGFTPEQLLSNVVSYLYVSFLPLTDRPHYYHACAVAIALLLAARLALLYRRRSRPGQSQAASAGPGGELACILFLLAACVIAILPSLTMMPPGDHILLQQNTRLVYFPSAFAAAATALFLHFLLGPAASRRNGMVPVLAVGAGFSLLLAAQTFRLNQNWHHAGEMVKSALDSARPLLPARVIVALALPESFRRTHVLDNGLPEAIWLYHGRDQLLRLDRVSTVRIYRDADQVRVGKNTGPEAAEYPLLLTADGGFPSVGMDEGEGMYRAKRLAPDALGVRLEKVDRSAGDRVVYFSGDRLVEYR